MTPAVIQSKIAVLVAQYGETITMNPGGGASSYTFLGCVEAVSTAAPTAFATGGGLLLTTGGVPADVTIVSGAVNYQYPAVAVFMDALQSNVPPAANDVFSRDGKTLTIRVVFSHRLSNTILIYVALAS